MSRMSEPVNNPLLQGVAGADMPAWKRVLTGAAVGASHLAAILFTFVFWLVIPFIGCCVLAGVSVARHGFGDFQGPPVLMIPLMIVLFLVFNAVVCVVESAVITVICAALGITLDAVRRSMRWPLWVVPLVSVVVNAVLWPLVFLPFAATGWDARVRGLWTAGAVCLPFVLYWVALFFSERIFVIAGWAFKGLAERVRKWWEGTKKEDILPHEPGV
jgi:hypothetical protein